jgi:hypothetical protein
MAPMGGNPPMQGDGGTARSIVYPDDVFAYAFPTNDPVSYTEATILPSDKRELAPLDTVYLDEASFGVYLWGWPCGTALGEIWRFEFEDPTGAVIKHDIEYNIFGPYNWMWESQYSVWYEQEPFPYELCNNINFRTNYFGIYQNMRCLKDSPQVGLWKLRFKYYNPTAGWTTIEEWQINVLNEIRTKADVEATISGISTETPGLIDGHVKTWCQWSYKSVPVLVIQKCTTWGQG